MTIEKVTNYVTLKATQYALAYAEVTEYQAALKEGRKVFEPSKLELVSLTNFSISDHFTLVF